MGYVGVKCPDDETNEQHILRAPAITPSDHRAVYEAKCGRPHRGGVDQMRTPADRGEGIRKRGHFLRTSFMDKPQSQLTIREIAREVGISKTSVHKIAKQDLALKCFKIRQATDLTEANKQARRERSLQRNCSIAILLTW